MADVTKIGEGSERARVTLMRSRENPPEYQIQTILTLHNNVNCPVVYSAEFIDNHYLLVRHIEAPFNDFDNQKVILGVAHTIEEATTRLECIATEAFTNRMNDDSNPSEKVRIARQEFSKEYGDGKLHSTVYVNELV